MSDHAVRLQKYLSECGIASRRKAERLISAGRVKVNGKIANTLGTRCVPGTDRVEVDGRPIKSAPKGVILLNKPRGVVSTLSDPQGRRTVADYLTKHYRSYFPVGRLDLDSSGLIILTNDGELADRLMHPRFEADRGYLCEVEGYMTEAAAQRLERGVKLEDGIVSAHVEMKERAEEKSLIMVIVREGRNHLVRRLLERVGHPVIFLKRMWHGPFRLGSLRSGQIRKLSETEYRRIRSKVLTQT